MNVTWADHDLVLRADRTMHWPGVDGLVAADLHLGKAAAFRAAGLPVPETTTAATLHRLSAALAATGAGRLLVLGDLLHARTGRAAGTMDAVARWRERHANVDILLVRGNHDARAGDPPAAWGFRCVAEPHEVAGVALCHHPESAPPRRPALAGHVHPGAVLHDLGRSRRLPCFRVGPSLVVLPAFGDFTGMQVARARQGERVFVIAGDAVFEPRVARGRG